MAERPKRILFYAPVVWPDDSARSLPALAKELAAAARDRGDELTLLVTPMDLLGGAVVWPDGARLARVLPPAKLEPHGLPEASRDAYRQFSDLADQHDIALVPQAFGAIPSDCRSQLSVPSVLGIPHLDFEMHDFGARTDRYRREMERLRRFGQHFVFPSEQLRSMAAERFSIPTTASSVVPPIGSTVYRSPETIRALGLPERYWLSVGWNRPDQETAAVAESVADRFRQGRWPCPFVGLSEGIDRRPLASVAQLEFAAKARALFRDAGMQAGRDWFDLTHLEPQELGAVVAGATAVIGNGHAGSGPNWHTLSAWKSGVPIIDPHGERIECHLPPSVAPRLLGIIDALLRDPCPISHPAIRPAKPRDQRIAWLVSHTTLRDAEVPILRGLGYEVYTNKVLPSGTEYRSGSADFSWDHDSTLPTDALGTLNAFNFYQSELPREVSDNLQAYFGTIICASEPILIRELVKFYRGRILIRLFGNEHPKKYADLYDHYADGWMWRKLWQIQKRVWVAALYEPIAPWEPPLLANRAAVLPVALPERTLRAGDRWIGRDAKILFFCPSIKTAPEYYGKIYARFLEHFGDLPHVIGGSQSMPVKDANVTGYLTEDRFDDLLVHLRVMYYHSREPRHIHYHPLEAIAMGMPVVYMRGGLMEHFDQGDRAGACATDGEAREKLLRILDGDAGLIASIRAGQKSILAYFLPGFNTSEWRRVFHDGIMDASCSLDLPSCKPGVPLEIRSAEPLRGDSVQEILEVETFAFRLAEHRGERDELAGPIPSTPRTRRQRLRDAIPKPLQPPAKAVVRTLRYLKRGFRTPDPAGGKSTDPVVLTARQLDRHYLTEPPPAPDLDGHHLFDDLRLSLPQVRRALGDGWKFILDPSGILDANAKIEGLPRESWIVGFTHIAWETEDIWGPFTQSACREAMIWCRLAQHAIFANERDRALAVHRYGLDPDRTSVLPALALTGGIATDGLPATARIDSRFGLPPTFMLGYYSTYTNANSWALVDALRILLRRGVELPPLVLTESIKRRDCGLTNGRKSHRVWEELSTVLLSLGLVEGSNLFLLPALREARRHSLEVRARLSVIVPRWGAHAVRDVARAALARVPVIASSILPIAEAFGTSGDNLLLVDPDDAVGLANSIQRTLLLPDEAGERTERALAKALALNAPESLAAKGKLFAAVMARAVR